MGHLYKRYLFSKAITMVFFLLFCFFSLYILIDYSLHAQQFMKIGQSAPLKISKYYLFTIIKRLDIALPLSLLVATSHTLLALNRHLELVAFQVGSINIRKLLKPFFLISLFMTLLLYASFEFLLPKSLNYIDSFENKHFKYLKESSLSKEGVYVFPVKDTGKMIFSKYDKQTGLFEDIFLYLSSDHIWKIKSLTLSGEDAIGLYAEEFTRDPDGFLRKKDSFPKHLFKDLGVEFVLKKKPQVSYESEKISSLANDLMSKSMRYQEHSPFIKTHLVYKLLMPWLPFLCVLAICPFCVGFRRDLSTFKIYAISLVMLIFFFTLIDIFVILSESSIFPPMLTMSLPFFLLLSCFSWNYLKKC